MAALVGLGLSGCLQPIPNQSADLNAGKGVAGKVSGVSDKSYPVYTFYDADPGATAGQVDHGGEPDAPGAARNQHCLAVQQVAAGHLNAHPSR